MGSPWMVMWLLLLDTNPEPGEVQTAQPETPAAPTEVSPGVLPDPQGVEPAPAPVMVAPDPPPPPTAESAPVSPEGPAPASSTPALEPTLAAPETPGIPGENPPPVVASPEEKAATPVTLTAPTHVTFPPLMVIYPDLKGPIADSARQMPF